MPPPASCTSAARSTRPSQKLKLPDCNEHSGAADDAVFLADAPPSLSREFNGSHWYLGEDYSFAASVAAVRIQDHGRPLDPPLAHRRIRLRLGRRRPGKSPARFLLVHDRRREEAITAPPVSVQKPGIPTVSPRTTATSSGASQQTDGAAGPGDQRQRRCSAK